MDLNGYVSFSLAQRLRFITHMLRKIIRRSTEHESIDSIVSIFPRLHAVVIGPGLSRNRTLLNVANSVITSARQHQLPMVIDADGLFCIQSSPELVQGYSLAMLTPNVNEFKRLCEVMVGVFSMF